MRVRAIISAAIREPAIMYVRDFISDHFFTVYTLLVLKIGEGIRPVSG
jgi:hypothetical protein